MSMSTTGFAMKTDLALDNTCARAYVPTGARALCGVHSEAAKWDAHHTTLKPPIRLPTLVQQNSRPCTAQPRSHPPHNIACAHLVLDFLLVRPQGVVDVQQGQHDGDDQQCNVQVLDLIEPAHACVCVCVRVCARFFLPH